MTVFLQDPDVTLYVGDVREVMTTLPDGSVDCIATSPPFFGLRDYGTGTWEGGDGECEHLVRNQTKIESSTLAGGKKTTGHQQEGFHGQCPRCGAIRVDSQIGLEESPEAWADELVKVFRESRRVLSDTGTLWVECGDSYSSGGRGGGGSPRQRSNVGANLSPKKAPPGYKSKDIIGAPWLLAFALRADGWYLRQSIIWHKPNAMPESAKDRCTTGHSYVFLLSKQPKYFFDAEAIAEPAEWARWGDQTVPKHEGTDTASGWISGKTKEELQKTGDLRRGFRGEDDRESIYINNGNRETNGLGRTEERRGFDVRLDRADGMKHPRSVWTIPTRGYEGAHFATWPEALVEKIIKAGCPPAGTVLDPFMGSGTTAYVARKLGRKSVGIELNEEYAKLSAARLQQLSLLA